MVYLVKLLLIGCHNLCFIFIFYNRIKFMGLLDSIINCVVHNVVGKATENVEALLMKKNSL